MTLRWISLVPPAIDEAPVAEEAERPLSGGADGGRTLGTEQ